MLTTYKCTIRNACFSFISSILCIAGENIFITFAAQVETQLAKNFTQEIPFKYICVVFTHAKCLIHKFH